MNKHRIIASGRRWRDWVTIATLLAVVGPMTGCAINSHKNRRTLNKLDDVVTPQSAGAQIALAPLAIPVASGALLVDASVVNPVVALEPAAEDTYDLYWKPRNREPLTQAMLFLPIVVLTPPTYVVSWFIHAFFYGG